MTGASQPQKVAKLDHSESDSDDDEDEDDPMMSEQDDDEQSSVASNSHGPKMLEPNANWDKLFLRLRAYQRKHGDTHVPQRHYRDTQLSWFVQ